MEIKKLKRFLRKTPVLGKLIILVSRTFFKKTNTSYDVPSIWLNTLLQKEDKVQIVQIGSNDGVNGDPIYDLLKNNTNWRALFVEPIPYLFERLKKNYGIDDRFTFENVAINDGSSQIFYSVNEEAKTYLPNLPVWFDQLGSFNKNNILKHLDGILEPFIKETQLNGMSLNELFNKNHIREITLLHIDTEGYDWKILSQLNLKYIKPKIILVEHKHLNKLEKRSLIDYLKSDYLVFKLGGDLIGILNNHLDINDVKGLKGEFIK
jgi:FkbM family methyltransferase